MGVTRSPGGSGSLRKNYSNTLRNLFAGHFIIEFSDDGL